MSAPDPAQAPPADWEAYEEFAREALVALSAGSGRHAELLRRQLANASFVEMDYSGAGFFLTLDIRSEASKLERNGVIGDVHAEAPGYESPLGLLLFVEGGLARTLEVFAYADWPEDIRAFQCRYVCWKPSPDGNGATAINVAERDPNSMWSS